MDKAILTYSGKHLSLTDPQPEEICIADIAHGLAMNCRWGGQCRFHWSVASHSLMVARLVAMHNPNLALQALMHDASEAYMQDMAKPFKVHLPDFQQFEEGLMKVIAAKFGFSWPKDHAVSWADKVLLSLEGESLFEPPRHFGHIADPATKQWAARYIVEENPRWVETRFIDAFHRIDRDPFLSPHHD